VTTPFDVIKSRMMTNTLKDHKRGTVGWLKYIFKEEGILALLKGASVRTFLCGLGGSMFFWLYSSGLAKLNADQTFNKLRNI